LVAILLSFVVPQTVLQKRLIIYADSSLAEFKLRVEQLLYGSIGV